MLADIVFLPGSIVAWILVGLIAGWLAGVVMKGGGYGIIGDIVVGLLGSIVGGALFGLVAQGAVGFWGSILVSFLGACVMIAIVRLLLPGRAQV